MENIAAVLKAQVGSDLVFGSDEIEPRYLEDWAWGAADIRPSALIRPRTTADVSAVAKLCHAHRCPIVVQGGRTGLAGGATPQDGWCILSTERMGRLSAPDLKSATIEAEAGVSLQRLQDAADAVGLLFPLDIGGRGSCTVGGNISTNAGGNRVLRYGMMRDLVLGLEAVMADGTVVTSLNKMLKNNAGYDLKQLFIGSEGTLGIVTRAVFRLFPKPISTQTALCAVSEYSQVVDFLNTAKSRLGSTLAAFEVMWPNFYFLATERVGRRPPVAPGAGAYVLVESMGTNATHDATQFEEFLGSASEQGQIDDAVIARSGKESKEIWSIRDASGEFHRTFWPYVGFDVSLPIGEIGHFIDKISSRLSSRWEDIKVVTFGHVADSNIHICVRCETADVQPEGAINEVIYECVGQFCGSISAEHGIGVLKKRYLHHSRNEAEIALMRALKRSLDPRNILNPGKVFDVCEVA